MSGAITRDDEQTSSVKGKKDKLLMGKEFVFVSFGIGARWLLAQSGLASSARDFLWPLNIFPSGFLSFLSSFFIKCL